MTLIDPAVDTDQAEALEAATRTVMAMRAGLKHTPGTHGKQAELLAECDGLLEEYNLLTLGR